MIVFRNVILGMLLVAAPYMALAQETPPESAAGGGDAEGQDTFTVDVDVVQVLFTVTDGDDRLVPGLTEEDFAIYEDGVRQQIQTFEAQSDLPLTLVVAMDTSGSVRTKLEFEQEAAIEFFFTVIERRRDEGMLVTFDSEVQVLQDFTDSPERLSEAVREIRVGGSSAMYDAVYLAVSQKVAERPPGRRIMVVISDGDDNASQTTLADALEVAQRNDVVIYTISTNSTADFGADRQDRGDRLLEQLAEETGGRAFYPLELEDLVSTLDGIADELRSQYEITYISTNTARDGRYREIEIRSRGGDRRINSRSGYYGPTD